MVTAYGLILATGALAVPVNPLISADVVGELDVDDEELFEGGLGTDDVRASLAVALVDEELVIVDGQNVAHGRLRVLVQLIGVFMGLRSPAFSMSARGRSRRLSFLPRIVARSAHKRFDGIAHQALWNADAIR